MKDTNTIAYVMRLAYPQWLWLFRTPKPHKKRDELFLKLKRIGFRLRWREERIIGRIWSLLDREFNVERFNYLKTKYYGLYGHIDWKFYDIKGKMGSTTLFLVYTICCSVYCCWQAFFMEEEHFLELTYQKRKYGPYYKSKR